MTDILAAPLPQELDLSPLISKLDDSEHVTTPRPRAAISAPPLGSAERRFIEGIQDAEDRPYPITVDQHSSRPRKRTQEQGGRPRKRTLPQLEPEPDTKEQVSDIVGTEPCLTRVAALQAAIKAAHAADVTGLSGVVMPDEPQQLEPEKDTIDAEPCPPAGFSAVTASSIDEQANIFLKAFVFDFQNGQNGGFSGVLKIAEAFRSFLSDPSDSDLEVDTAHRFLESRSETATVAELRAKMRTIDTDSNSRMALIEYLLFKFDKSVASFLNPPFEVPRHLLEALEAATATHRAHWDERHERDALYDSLDRASKAGGVKGLRAKAELAVARDRCWTYEWTQREVVTAYGARQAMRAVARADKETAAAEAMEQEQKRLEAEKAMVEEKASKLRSASRKALAARASTWGELKANDRA